MVTPGDAMDFGPLALLDQSSRDGLRAQATIRDLEAGETLIRERAPGEDAYLLLEGTVRVTASDEPRMLAIISAPALVGELAAITDQRRSANVIADTPCTVLTLPGRELRRLMERRPIFASALRERADLLLADAFLKRRSPLRDLPSHILTSLASHLRSRVLAHDQLVEGNDDDICLVRRGAVELIRDGARTMPGEFMQREPGERYAAVGETWIYELRLADVAHAIVGYQDRLREIAGQLDDRSRVKLRPNCRFITDANLGGVLVHNERERAVLSEPVARLARTLDGQREVWTLVAQSTLGRGPVIEGLAVLVAADLATLA